MSVADNYFEKLYRSSEDPWSFRERWYEQRKRNLTLAALPRSHYGNIFEPGCANGELSVRLAERCSQLLCSDTSAIALELARTRLEHRCNVRLLQTRLPEQWPQGRFDLIVLSELCYYLDSEDLDRLIEHARASLNQGGNLLACHWRWPIDECPLSGDEVHQRLHAGLGLPRLSRLEEADMLLEVWGTQPTSVAQREGLAPLAGHESTA
ncbi:class I SAM-dependent methyltransferase [Pseudomonas seleniipraecipitans]|uniref:Class I SAM-dependent methyltransferase n=1 Tax=Phytopseudomonas seleniipraecipitans TaxID=640205 RepID=A0A1G7T5V1_9GAMM|nr:class I SAM-dependent methyltransferase [Pseudomonas seleniipraecipitans]UUD64699.1 class I SAM-dependent methyltransferase [Pseudomonas seleniipraecipitans]SDG30676.1 Nodulation protein S (NodS) [Pseudomonas seleniipraecipitans]